MCAITECCQQTAVLDSTLQGSSKSLLDGLPLQDELGSSSSALAPYLISLYTQDLANAGTTGQASLVQCLFLNRTGSWSSIHDLSMRNWPAALAMTSGVW